jgi:hypothetical protein
MSDPLSVSDAARELSDARNKVKPRDISDLFYRRVLNDEYCRIVAGRRLIPRDYLSIIRWALRKSGKPVAPEPQETANA